jgi:hypothetical protein
VQLFHFRMTGKVGSLIRSAVHDGEEAAVDQRSKPLFHQRPHMGVDRIWFENDHLQLDEESVEHIANGQHRGVSRTENEG